MPDAPQLRATGESGPSVADRVIERARNRKRPLMPDDETAIRVLVDHLCEDLRARGDYPTDETFLIDYCVSALGGIELQVPDDQSKPVTLSMHAPDPGMYDDPADCYGPDGPPKRTPYPLKIIIERQEPDGAS